MLVAAMIGAAGSAADALRKVRDLDAVAKAIVDRGPTLAIDRVAFAAHVGSRLDGAPDVEEALADLHAEDLFLAYACGTGVRAAIAALDRQIGPVVEGARARMKGKASVEDVAQLLREKLLVPRDGAPPKVLDYSGRGPLGGWMRIAAVRTALDLGRHGDAASMRPVSREMLLEVPAPISDDPELDHLRKRYARDFKQAFEEAIRELSVEDRNLLRLSLVDGLSIDEIGAVFGYHRATAARKVARAKDLVQERTRKILTDRLDVASAELRSIMGYIKSHLDLSIQRLLAREAIEPETPKAKKKNAAAAKKSAAKKPTNAPRAARRAKPKR